MRSIEIIAFFVPFIIIGIVLYIIREKLNSSNKILFAIIVYIISIITGVISQEYFNVGNMESAVIAGIGAPIFYSIFYIISLNILDANKKKSHIQLKKNRKDQWKPIIYAAIIQSIATIIAAIISNNL